MTVSPAVRYGRQIIQLREASRTSFDGEHNGGLRPGLVGQVL